LKEVTAELRIICLCEFSWRRQKEEGHGIMSFLRFFYGSLYSFHVLLLLQLKFLKSNNSPFQKLKKYRKNALIANTHIEKSVHNAELSPQKKINRRQISQDTLSA